MPAAGSAAGSVSTRPRRAGRGDRVQIGPGQQRRLRRRRVAALGPLSGQHPSGRGVHEGNGRFEHADPGRRPREYPAQPRPPRHRRRTPRRYQDRAGPSRIRGAGRPPWIRRRSRRTSPPPCPVPLFPDSGDASRRTTSPDPVRRAWRTRSGAAFGHGRDPHRQHDLMPDKGERPAPVASRDTGSRRPAARQRQRA